MHFEWKKKGRRRRRPKVLQSLIFLSWVQHKCAAKVLWMEGVCGGYGCPVRLTINVPVAGNYLFRSGGVCVRFKATWWRLMFVNSVTEEEKLIVKLSGTRWWRGGKQREKRWPMQIDGLSQPMAQLSHLQHLIVPPHTHTPPPPLSSLHSLNAHCTRTLPLPFYLQLSLLTPITFTLWIWDIYIYIYIIMKRFYSKAWFRSGSFLPLIFIIPVHRSE